MTTYGQPVPSTDSDHLEKSMKTDNGCLMKTALLLFGGTSMVFVANKLDYDGSGPLGALCLAMGAGTKFRLFNVDKPIDEHLELIWTLTEPFLFGLIGAEVKISSIDTSSIVMVVGLVIVDIIFRSIVTYLSACGAGMSMKEKAFIALVWLNKAAVQAAVGPIALDIAKANKNQRQIELGTLVVTICFMTIIISTSIGSLGMAITAKRFLTKSNQQAVDVYE